MSHVASVVVPGTEDPAELVRRGGLELDWVCSQTGRQIKVKDFEEEQPKQLEDQKLMLPPLYLHFLDRCFLPRRGEFDDYLRAGNDNSEIMLVLPQDYSRGVKHFGANEEVLRNLEKALGFLKMQSEVGIARVTQKGAAYSAVGNPQRLFFGLKTSRPKAPVSNLGEFGIPSLANIYLFAENHVSVNHMSLDTKHAFLFCIQNLSETGSPDLQKLGTLLKIFYEGGFAYNQKGQVSNGGVYVPTNVGVAGLGTTPAFEGQMCVSTGHPYLLTHQFLSFSNTVPVTIDNISAMSHRHCRYGLCFTRCVHVWEDESFQTDSRLKFCSILPYGGFYYVPESVAEYQQHGGLIYAFRQSAAVSMDSAEPSMEPAPQMSQLSETPPLPIGSPDLAAVAVLGLGVAGAVAGAVAALERVPARVRVGVAGAVAGSVAVWCLMQRPMEK